MLHDLLRSRRRPRLLQTGSTWHPSGFGTTAVPWLGTGTREHRARNGTATRCQRRSREPEQSRHGVDTARPPPLAPGPAGPGRLLRLRPGRPCAAPHRGTPGPWAPTGGRATAPPRLKPGTGNPPPHRSPARDRGDAAGAGSKLKNKGFSNFFTSCHLCKANTG